MIRSLPSLAKTVRTHPPSVSVVFCRYKSITAAIERGKRHYERPSTSRLSSNTRGSFRDSQKGISPLGDRPIPRASYKERGSRERNPARFERSGKKEGFRREEIPRGNESFRKEERPRRNEGFEREERLRKDEGLRRQERPQKDEGFDREERSRRNDGFRREERPRRNGDFGEGRPGSDGGFRRDRRLRSDGNKDAGARRDEDSVRSMRPGEDEGLPKDVRPANASYGERAIREQRNTLYERPRRFDRDPKVPDTGAADNYARRRDNAPSKSREIVPDILPYTTAASEFLYGHSVVLAALKANRRKLYNLYIHDRGQNHEGGAAIATRARMLKVNTRNVGDAWLRILDKASSGRPHNGFILEASALPRPPITELGASSMKEQYFTVKLDKQSKEDALVNGSQEQYEYSAEGWRHPLVLYADGVLDEGNLGAIARSAYFLGVDAIATPTRQSAPWSHIALKASAGAAEAIPIFSVNQPAEFLSRSAREGWRVYASDAIAPQTSTLDTGATNVVYAHARGSKSILDHHPVASHPTILMMGAEGSGLRNTLLNQAHYKIGIRAGRNVAAAGVDSLNVSVAASLLCFEVLKKPMVKEQSEDKLF